VGGDVNVNENVSLEVDPDEVENRELKGEGGRGEGKE
jgi:hypothetical protein